ncbi:hypothetical protein L9F63_008274, partial [Diploptera punctata]
PAFTSTSEPTSTSTSEPTFTSTSEPTSPKAITQYDVTNIGPIISKYLVESKGKDKGDLVFGLTGGNDGKFYMGDSEIVFDNDNLIINGTKYKATNGLMSLLTMIQSKQNLPEDDMLNYENNLISSNCIYHNNDPGTSRPKSSRGDKYISIISPIWERMTMGVSKSNQYFSPSRRDSDLDYTKLPKEFIWMNDVRKLVDRLIVIMGEEQSGNDNLYLETPTYMNVMSLISI